MAGPTLNVLLCAALLAMASGQHFLKHLPKIQPAKIAKQSPAEVAKAAAQTAANAAQGAKKVAQIGADKPKEAAKAAEALVKQAEPQKQAAQALDGAGEMLKHAAQAAAATNASAVAKTAQGTVDSVLPTGMRPKDIEHASKGDVENVMRTMTPKAAETVEHMGAKVAKKIDEEAPRAANTVNRMGTNIADRMFGPIPKGATGLPSEIEDQIRGLGVAPILGSLFVLVAGGAVVTDRLFKRAPVARSPVLLGGGGEPADEEVDVAVQMSSTSGGVEFSRF